MAGLSRIEIITLLAIMMVDILGQGLLTRLVRRRRGENAAASARRAVRVFYPVAFTAWCLVVLGFWWGAGVGGAMLLAVAGEWLYRRRRPAMPAPLPSPSHAQRQD